MSTYISRSTFLKGLAGISLAAVGGRWWLAAGAPPLRNFPCRMLGPSRSVGHAMRDGKLTFAPSEHPSSEHAVVIVGGGIAGLSAAWWLQKHGCDDFIILELEKEVGGNATSGKNQVSAYPWGAHYIPLANKESEYVAALFEELGVIQGHNANGLPIYNEEYLCHDPEERLLKDGAFQEGLVPRRGLQPAQHLEIAKFFDLVTKYRNMTGSDGRLAFAIPLDLSSADPQFRNLDKISMLDWMKQQGFVTKPLHWYVNYCCRDDYGSTLDMVSAWAGIHYFAGRRGIAANAENNWVVTWPEGNGFVVNRLKEKLAKHIRTGMVAGRVQQDGHGVLTVAVSEQTGQPETIRSKFVIFAAPRFIAKHIVTGCHAPVSHMKYAPWLVANITLKTLPQGRGASVAWDNVSYYSDSLGYVVATHQDITTRPLETVLTYYYPLSHEEPNQARSTMIDSTTEQWAATICDDLEKMHNGITSEIISMDIWPWGHGMIRPSVGYIWGEARRRMKDSIGPILFAHSDMSGISNFEEAQYHGVEAANKILSSMKA